LEVAVLVHVFEAVGDEGGAVVTGGLCRVLSNWFL
jgi:hypothetical protein